MPVLLLSEDDVRQLLTMEDALELVESGLRKLALDEAENVPRSRCRTDHVILNVMPAAAKGLGYLGYKVYTVSRQDALFHFALLDGRSGELLSFMRADYLGQMRTGAASGVATKFLARPDAATVGLFGTGKQARTQLLAVCRVRSVKRVQVYSRSAENRNRFAADMSRECGVEVVPAERPELAARDQDIVITATASHQPVLQGDWLAEGTHVNAIGANYIGKAEIDTTTLRRAGLIVVDNKEQAKIEAGALVTAVDEGAIHWADVAELGAVIVGRARGRRNPQEITLFKSLGIAIEDVAVAARVHALAKEKGLGQMIDW